MGMSQGIDNFSILGIGALKRHWIGPRWGMYAPDIRERLKEWPFSLSGECNVTYGGYHLPRFDQRSCSGLCSYLAIRMCDFSGFVVVMAPPVGSIFLQFRYVLKGI